jgi:hypothetical protein
MVIALDLKAPLEKATSFAAWLPKHAGLVRSIAASVRPPGEGFHPFSGHTQQPHTQIVAGWKALQNTLNPAARTARPAADAAGSAPAPAAAQQHNQQQQQQQQLRLVSFSSNWLLDVGIVNFLPAGSLTQLDLELPFQMPSGLIDVPNWNGPELACALAQLSNLQQLRLASTCRAMPTTCLSAVAQLSRLTRLALAGLWGEDRRRAAPYTPPRKPVEEALKQLLGEPLPLRHLHLGFYDRCHPANLSLAAQTQLTSLHIGCTFEGDGGGEVVLPPQLLHLDWAGCTARDVGSLQLLQQLRQLKVLVLFDGVGPLLQLTQLPALTDQALVYDDQTVAFDTRSAWKQLPQLRELDFSKVEDLIIIIRLKTLSGGSRVPLGELQQLAQA